MTAKKNGVKMLMLATACALMLILLGIVPATAPRGTQQVAAAPAAPVDYARITTVLAANRVFDEQFFDDLNLIEEATIVLLAQSVELEDGSRVIRGSLISDFCRNLYGREVDLSAANYDNLTAPAGAVAILPRGYAELTHHNLSATVLEDGRIEVASSMTVEFDDTVTCNVITTLAVDESSSFGYRVLGASIME